MPYSPGAALAGFDSVGFERISEKGFDLVSCTCVPGKPGPREK